MEPTMTEPRTKAGRALWAEWDTEALEGARWQHYLDAILAIEAQAASLLPEPVVREGLSVNVSGWNEAHAMGYREGHRAALAAFPDSEALRAALERLLAANDAEILMIRTFREGGEVEQDERGVMGVKEAREMDLAIEQARAALTLTEKKSASPDNEWLSAKQAEVDAEGRPTMNPHPDRDGVWR
jgi:hypothetical protein